ncbi:calcium-binding protein [Bradyrhizobium sp. BWA-3-5]|uniref:calcium-binding protein n=1 Tax=Bradyrhizobium sp. BWA-3-5 TaxID=3080013 RepID=UPI00293F222D|nr:calcium-binding protein [Bradyrhizobium sp. BWA-3-5]WOH64307.1 calcium-binding protein [Bradyrhizobium sp. BWA-3-5]
MIRDPHGNDWIGGGPVNDSISAGGGNDRVFGSAGNDQIFGEEGNDYLYGGDYGGNGRDQPCITAADNDKLCGGPGDDALFAGDGRDSLIGGAGRKHFWDPLYRGNGPLLQPRCYLKKELERARLLICNQQQEYQCPWTSWTARLYSFLAPI